MINKSTGFFKSFDGTPIYYEVRGMGPPIVMCYGIACVSNHWQHQIRYFSQAYQTINFDYRGHHRSPTPANRENLNIDSLAQDIFGLVGHLGFERASLWGHSFGAQVLLRTYDMFPQLFANLILVNGFASNPLMKALGQELGKEAFRSFRQVYLLLPESTKYVWRKVLSNPLTVRVSALLGGFNLNLTSFKDAEIYARGLAAIDPEVFIPLFDQMLSYDATPVLERIQAPTLIISGKKDTVTPASYQELLHRKIVRSQFLSVPYGSHSTQLDLPDFVNLRIEKFLRENNYTP